MVSKHTHLFFKSFQILSILPLDYNHLNGRFSYSKHFHFYSIATSVIILLLYSFSTTKCIISFLTETNLRSSMNYADVFCTSLFYISNIFMSYLILTNKIFHMDQVIEMANSILKIGSCANLQIMKFNNYIAIRIVTDVIIFPISILILNATYFYNVVPKLNLTLYGFFISFTTLWIRISFLPLQFLFKYFEAILKNFNKILLNTHNFKLNSQTINETIEHYSKTYSLITKITKDLNQQYGLHVIIYLFGIYFLTVWQIYRVLDSFVFQITPLSVKRMTKQVFSFLEFNWNVKVFVWFTSIT